MSGGRRCVRMTVLCTLGLSVTPQHCMAVLVALQASQIGPAVVAASWMALSLSQASLYSLSITWEARQAL